MDTTFFVASKTLGALLRAETWIVIAMAVTVLTLLLGRRRLASTVSASTLIAVLLLSILPLGDLLLRPLERSHAANPSLRWIDGIVVLGGAEDSKASHYWGQTQLNGAGERLTTAVALARRFPEARVLFTGGSGAVRDLLRTGAGEASAAEQFFREQGLDASRLILEGRSRNTAENARLGLEAAKPRADEIWVLVTSASHMPRAVRSFDAAGWPPLIPYPVDFRSSLLVDGIGWNLTRNLEILDIALKEYVGYVAYALAK